MKFKPFSDTGGLVLTDKYGNELNVEQDSEQVVIYGQWQGKPNAPEFIQFVESMKSIQDYLKKKKITSINEAEGFTISHKKGEIFLSVDTEIEKNDEGASKLLRFFTEVNSLET